MPSCPFCRLRTPTGTELQEHILHKHPQEASDPSEYNFTQRKPVEVKSIDPYIVVDGNNVCYYDGNIPKVKYLKLAHFQIKKQGYTPIIYVSAALRHKIDSTMELVRLINLGWVIETEAGEDDDVFIIEEAQRKRCEIITNDTYKEYIGKYDTNDWSLEGSLKKFSINECKFEIQ
ncbi:MAG: NYN domain-containing protein [Candidatus Kariarchaeaceae archaeon]|jgi:hypothetical protein